MELSPAMTLVIQYVTAITSNALTLVLFKKMIDHFEGGNSGATWTSAALVMFVPWLFDAVLNVVFWFVPEAVFKNLVVGYSVALVVALGRLAFGVALVRWRYRLQWLYSTVLYVGAWILSGLIGTLIGAPIVLLLSLFWP